MAWAGIIVAATVSLTSNIYHDMHVMIGREALNPALAILFGFAPPFLSAVVGHMAAVSGFNRAGKTWTYLLTIVMMGVSAYGTASTIHSADGWYAGIAFAVGIDAISITCLYVLIEASGQARRYQAHLAAHEAAAPAPAVPSGVPSRVPSGVPSAIPSAAVPSAGNGSLKGTTEPVPSAGQRSPGEAALGAVPVPASGQPAQSSRPSAARTATVRATAPQPGITGDELGARRQTREVMYQRARLLKKELAAQGLPLTKKAYTDRWGGKSTTVGEVVSDVNAEADDDQDGAHTAAAGTGC
jgi:hypothetical protein